MGALTNKILEFKYRLWDNTLSFDIDNSDFNKNVIRSERSKIKQIKKLPVNNWLSNFVRFSLKNPSFNQESTKNNIINKCLIFVKDFMKKEILLEIKKIYVNFLVDNTTTFFIAQESKSSTNKIFNDLLVLRNHEHQLIDSDLLNKIQQNDVMIISNSRVELPSLNNTWRVNHTLVNHLSGISVFNSDLLRSELPLTGQNIVHFLEYGLININHGIVFISFFINLPRTFDRVILLKPFYMSNTLTLSKNRNTNYFTLVSKKKYKIFYNVLYTSNKNIKAYLIINNQKEINFNSFPTTRVTQKFLNLLTILVEIKFNKLLTYTYDIF